LVARKESKPRGSTRKKKGNPQGGEVSEKNADDKELLVGKIIWSENITGDRKGERRR